MIKPTHKPIKEFLQHREQLSAIGVLNEGGVSSSFQMLLQRAAPKGWSLIPQEPLPKSRLRPDGTLKDDNGFRRGYWEAKDSKDDLDKEIEKKRALGYPHSNIIYEDSLNAVLIQNKREVLRVPLTNAKGVADLLNHYYAYTEPHIEEFEAAVDEFKDRVPDLAAGLVQKIEDSHRDNREFRDAFASFHELCKTSLNPGLRKEAVEEMLVQHLLTERLIRNIFDNPEFRQRNVIATEIEKVIGALTGKHFNRQQYMEGLNRFYLAIESAAKNSSDFSEKQHMLNSVYERFFQGYAVKVADTHGIVYTPQPIVDFMCASVVEVLKSEFNKELGDPDVCIIDPCTGTGNFIVNLLPRFSKRDLPRVYKHQLFANEVMLMPYYIAALNIEHAYFEITGEYEPFEGLCFVDTLGMAESEQGALFNEKNVERVDRQKKAPITVVIANPPYNANQVNENDNNKNRKYKILDKRVADTYARDSKATNRNKLGDPYVKFFRWATDRLEKRDGVVCYISNNSFVDQIAFDGMRHHLHKDFDSVYHADLHGNVYKNPKLSGTTHNVFGIKVGVGITVGIKKHGGKKKKVLYTRLEEFAVKGEKYAWLEKHESVANVKWETLKPDAKNNWFVAANEDEFAEGVAIGSKEAKADKGSDAESIFKLYTIGVKTNRDRVVYDFDSGLLEKRVTTFIDSYNSEVDRYLRTDKSVSLDDFVNYDLIDWSRDLKKDLSRGKYVKFDQKQIRESAYRPYLRLRLYFDSVLNQDITRWPKFMPDASVERENATICVTGIGSSKPFYGLVTNTIPCFDYLEKCQCFPFYVYNEDGSGRRENITDWALGEFRERYAIAGLETHNGEGGGAPATGAAVKKAAKKIEASAKKSGKPGKILQAADGLQDDNGHGYEGEISKWDVFYYVYGMLHHPEYRARYADNLKRELPRIPYAPDFWAFSKAGKRLADLHLKYEELTPYKLKFVETPKKRLSYKVEKMKLSKNKNEVIVNDSLTLAGIPKEVFEYKLGNRSALDWVIDQYRIKTDKRSGITHDPNREDDPEYIVRLIGQVVQVSLETVRIVKSLPKEFREKA